MFNNFRNILALHGGRTSHPETRLRYFFQINKCHLEKCYRQPWPATKRRSGSDKANRLLPKMFQSIFVIVPQRNSPVQKSYIAEHSERENLMAAFCNTGDLIISFCPTPVQPIDFLIQWQHTLFILIHHKPAFNTHTDFILTSVHNI